jgi:hypothetical protein
MPTSPSSESNSSPPPEPPGPTGPAPEPPVDGPTHAAAGALTAAGAWPLIRKVIY